VLGIKVINFQRESVLFLVGGSNIQPIGDKRKINENQIKNTKS